MELNHEIWVKVINHDIINHYIRQYNWEISWKSPSDKNLIALRPKGNHSVDTEERLFDEFVKKIVDKKCAVPYFESNFCFD